jgi:tripartite-type tricarboxylate transporter receptor subunit TctC
MAVFCWRDKNQGGRPMIRRAALAALIAANTFISHAFTSHAATAQTFPSRPMTIVLGYAAGGQADVLARKVAQQLGENLKISVVVENRTGGNTLIASQSVARAPADGHTLILVTDGMTTIDPMVPGGNGFDPLQAFDLVINLATAPLFLAAKKDLPVNSLAELVEYGKKNPTALHFGTSGPTTPHRIAGEMMKQLGGFQMSHVAYRGTSASVNDLAGGHIPLVIGAASALMPLASEGKIKILAVTSEKRFALLPDVPPVSDTFPGFNVLSFLGLAVNKGTPEPLLAQLNAELNKVLANPEVREFLVKQGMNVGGGTREAFAAQVVRDRKGRGDIIRDMKIVAE